VFVGIAAMSWFDILKRGGNRTSAEPLPPIKTVQEPGRERRERLAREAEAADVAARPVADKDIDPFDTGSLEVAGDVDKSDNPYDTQAWQKRGSSDPLRVADLEAINKDRVSGKEDNPYDTVVQRKGW
jgi:hypothetical protein